MSVSNIEHHSHVISHLYFVLSHSAEHMIFLRMCQLFLYNFIKVIGFKLICRLQNILSFFTKGGPKR